MTNEDVDIDGLSDASPAMRSTILSTIDTQSSEAQDSTEDSQDSSISGIDKTEKSQPNLEGDIEKTIFFKMDNVSDSTPFVPEDPNKPDRSFPIKGNGQVDSILLISDRDSYTVTFSVDDNDILERDSWSSINTISQELPHISAYEQSGSGNYVLSINDYVYSEEVNMSIRPSNQVTFDTIRVEMIADSIDGGE